MYAAIQVVYSHHMSTPSMEYLRRSVDRMNDQRIGYGAKDKRYSVQWIRIQTAIVFLVRKIWTHTPSTSGY